MPKNVHFLDRRIDTDYNRQRPFKTVNNMVNYYMSVGSGGTAHSACGYIVRFCYDELLKVLQSETNKPSKHDLLLIFKYSKRQDSKRAMKILEIYKNRKE